MKNFENKSNGSGQSSVCNGKSKKHEANLQKNSSLYFQVGLILCLMITYGLFEMNFEEKSYNLSQVDIEDRFVEVTPELFQMAETIKQKSVENLNKTEVLYKEPVVKPDDYETPASDILIEPEVYAEPIDPDRVIVVSAPAVDEPEIFDILGVEQVPIYPGCEAAETNDERRACMSDKLSILIKNKFDTNIASELGLSGIQKIYVQFKIDKTGKVTDVLSRAPLQRLENEAERVLNTVPQMVPGKQRHRPVSVIYNLPIIFDVQ